MQTRNGSQETLTANTVCGRCCSTSTPLRAGRSRRQSHLESPYTVIRAYPTMTRYLFELDKPLTEEASEERARALFDWCIVSLPVDELDNVDLF